MTYEFNVANFNVENLNSPNIYFAGREDRPYTGLEFEQKADFVAGVLNRLDASIVGVQEIFDQEALAACIARSNMKSASIVMETLPLKIEPNGRRFAEGPNVGLITTFPLAGRPTWIPSFPREVEFRIPLGRNDSSGQIVSVDIRKFERPVLRAELDVPGLPGLTVLVAHLKSKNPKLLDSEDSGNPTAQDFGKVRSLIIRACEAVALRSIVRSIRNQRGKDGRRKPLILLGDLNDDIDSVSTRLVEGSRPFLKPGDNHVERATFARRTADLMLNALELTPPADGVAYSHIFEGVGTLIDMIFLSADFFPIEGRQRAEVLKTWIEMNHFTERPKGRIVLPPPEPFDGNVEPMKPVDPLVDILVANNGLPKPPKPISITSDHGAPVARLRIF